MRHLVSSLVGRASCPSGFKVYDILREASEKLGRRVILARLDGQSTLGGCPTGSFPVPSCIFQGSLRVKSPRGFSLVELIMVIAIAAIILPSVLIPFTSGIRRADRPEIYTTATYLAQERMELLRPLSFDNLTPVGSWVNETNITLNGRTYSRKYLIQWANSSMQTDDDDDDDGSDDDGDGINPPTGYKKITVTVSNSKISDVTLTTARTDQE